jgi:hypothetical protein
MSDAPVPAQHTEATAPPVKLPIVKRLILAVHGKGTVIAAGVGGALMMLALAAAGGFFAGVGVAAKRQQANIQQLTMQLRAAREEVAKAQAEHQKLEQEREQLKVQLEAAATDARLMKDELAALRLQNETLDKLLSTVQDRLSGKVAPAPENPTGARLKFGDGKTCDVKGGVVSSKSDVGCLDLKHAIEQMNSTTRSAAAKGGPDEKK